MYLYILHWLFSLKGAYHIWSDKRKCYTSTQMIQSNFGVHGLGELTLIQKKTEGISKLHVI
jgi:hypothetical protein